MFFFIEKRVMVENKLIYFFFSFDSSFFSLKQNKFIEEKKKKSKVSFVVDSMFILFQLLTMEVALRIKVMARSKVIAFFLPLNLVFVINYHKLAFQKKHNCIFILFQLLTMEHVLGINFMVKNKIISHLFDLILFYLFYHKLTIEKNSFFCI